MKRQTSPTSLPLVSLTLLCASMFGAACEQPPILCEVASGSYAVKYFPKTSGDDCLMMPGELVGMSMYNPPKGDDREINALEATIAIQAASLGNLADDANATANAIDPNPAHKQYAFGDYTARPDENDFCATSNLAPAEQAIPETAYTNPDGSASVYPETTLKYDWKAMRLYMTFAAPGNAATGEVEITRTTKDIASGAISTCTTTYIASALYPTVGCEAIDVMGEGTGKPDDSRCCATADPAKGRPFGSGIHPDFRVKCDATLLQCILDWTPGETFPPLGGNKACGN